MGATPFFTAAIFLFQVVVELFFDVDCPCLHRIEFGEGSFVNEKNAKARLSLENLPRLDEIRFRYASFRYCHELHLASNLEFAPSPLRLPFPSRSCPCAGRRSVLLFPNATHSVSHQSLGGSHFLSEAECDSAHHTSFLACLFSQTPPCFYIKKNRIEMTMMTIKIDDKLTQKIQK